MTKSKINIFFSILIALVSVCFFASDALAGDPVTSGCRPLPARIAEIESCALCPLFEVILNADQSIATKSFSSLAAPFRSVVIVLLALFIAYHTLILVSSVTKQDAPKYINTLLVQVFKSALTILLLTNSAFIYSYVINPIMGAGLEFGLALLLKSGDFGEGRSALDELRTLSAASTGKIGAGVIEQEVLANVLGAIKLFNKSAAKLPAIGSTLICVSVNEGTKFLINFEMFFQGLVLMAFGWAIVLISCFYLLDSAVRFGIFCALVPFLIAMWPYKVTTKYTKSGWDIFMNAVFNFVMIGLVISLTSELVIQASTGGKGGATALEDALNGNDIGLLKGMMDISGLDFIVLLATCMFAFKLVGQIGHLASEVSGTDGGTSIGGKMGAQAAQAAKKVAKTAVKAGKAVASGGASVAEEVVEKGMSEKMKDATKDMKDMKDAIK